jgi:hypothetical protein
MSRTRFALHVAAAVAALSLMMLAVAVGVGEGQPAGPAQTSTAPSQLTEQYPLGDRKLAQDGSAAEAGGGGGSAAARRPGASDDGGSMLWLLFLIPVAVLVLAVWLMAYARSGPPTAYGYALGHEPRRRRRVRSSAIRVLSPLFAYNHHRDAYVLRGIGNRRGPVLKLKREDVEQWAVKPARAAPAAAPLGVRGEARAAGAVQEPAAARARPNGGAPADASPPATAEADTAAKAPATAKPKPTKSKSAKAKATKKTKAGKAGKNGKGKKAPAAPKSTKPKTPKREPAPSLTEAMNGERTAPTGRFKRDEVREDRPATKTRK